MMQTAAGKPAQSLKLVGARTKQVTLTKLKSSATIAPAVGAKFDLRQNCKSNLQIRQRRVVCVDDFAHFGDGRLQITPAKQTRARDKCVGSGAGAFGGGLVVDAAVHADAVVQIPLAP